MGLRVGELVALRGARTSTSSPKNDKAHEIPLSWDAIAPRAASPRSNHGDRAVVVAVAVVRVVQVTIDEVVDVIPVRHRFVPATGAVDVIGGMAGARVVGRAVGRVLVADREPVLVDVVVVDVVEVPVVQKVDVALVVDGGVPAAVAVGVRVVLVGLAGHRVAFLMTVA